MRRQTHNVFSDLLLPAVLRIELDLLHGWKSDIETHELSSLVISNTVSLIAFNF